MNRRLGSGIGLAALTLILSSGVIACGDDGEPDPPLEDLNGVWDFTWTNTATSGICADENGEVSTGVITISEDLPAAIGSEVIMSGFEGEAANTVVGSIASGNLIVAQGSYPEGSGTTTTRYEMESASATRMEGTEFWSFTNNVGSCPSNTASVVAIKR